jgi:cold shock CspA family protein
LKVSIKKGKVSFFNRRKTRAFFSKKPPLSRNGAQDPSPTTVNGEKNPEAEEIKKN